MMKALSIKQPHADRILFAGKDVENRTWRLPQNMVGERILVHAGKRADGPYNESADRLGAILGEVTITGCVEASSSEWFVGPLRVHTSRPVPL